MIAQSPVNLADGDAVVVAAQDFADLFGCVAVGNLGGFAVMLIVSAFFYWVYAFFREQICTMVCPYGRMQGVLLDSNSIVVSYDYIRGEPRGNKSKGDCIDCHRCLAVCPTGIDIRNGTQLECVNCTACIAACDPEMTQIHKPTGLIRFDSYNGIKEGRQLKFGGRLIGYSVVLVALVGLLSYLLISRADVETTVLRVPGQLFQETPEGNISNLYNIQVINKTFDDIELE